MTDRLLALRAFVRTAHSGSLSRAARELGLSQPSISRILSALEREIGAALLVRTTRAVTLTDAGADYLSRIEPLLSALAEAEHAARGTGELRGTLRIALSTSFGVREVVPRLPAFLERHPALRIDLDVSDARQDLVADGVDVAFRIGPMSDSSALQRKLAEAPLLLLASPHYLRRWDRPRVPSDLARHAVIIGPGPTGAWEFAKEGRRVSVRVEGRVRTASNEGATASAVAGLGLTRTSLWGCRAELERGALVKVLDDWPMDPVELHAIYPIGRAPSPAARAFTQYLASQL
jgi:DNA-binding transcriptional LysR family regulator